MLATIIDFFTHLFDTADFPARWHCGTWSSGHGWLHIGSDLGIFAAYVTIPILLIIFVRRRPDTPFPRVFWLFSAFILTCGLTHHMEAIIFWEPVYRLSGVIKLSTATASWLTVFAMVKVLPEAMKLTTPAELRTEVERQTRALSEHIAENELLLEELSRSRDDFDRFAYSVSHDLRAPVRAIDGFGRLLTEEHADQLDAEGHRLLGVVRSNARRMGLLIDDLLQFARLGRTGVDRATVDMERLAREVVEDALENHQGQEVDVEIDDLPQIMGDRAMLRQVWHNLIGNAIKYTRDADGARVRVTARRGDDVVRYIVEDNGVGFDPDYAGKIFGVFERLHTEDEFEGTGVGLAIVEQIVERHGGRVGATAAPGEGATLWFELPIRQQDED